MNVPSKAFGEWVEHHYGTESVDPPELKQWIDSGRKMIVLDSRTQEEFTRMSIPTGIRCRARSWRIASATSPPTRTRWWWSIAPAAPAASWAPRASAAPASPTRSWRCATAPWDGNWPVCNASTAARAVRPRHAAHRRLALERAKAFAAESGVREISPGQLAVFEADKSRTLYVLDARDPSEYRAGHRKGSYSAPGGQLVQGTDNWVGVRGARIVVVDDTGVRARMSAAWLRQMGHKDVFVADNALGTETGSGLPDLAPPAPTITVEQLAKREPGTAIIDLARSIDFRAGHIEHAIWGVRGRLPRWYRNFLGPRIVLTSPDGSLARFAIAEVKDMTRPRSWCWTAAPPPGAPPAIPRWPIEPTRPTMPASTSICAPTIGIQVLRRR
jgi:rhodanese-related sulfurtransferase